MIGKIHTLEIQRGAFKILGNDGVLYHAEKAALYDLSFDSSLAGQVSFKRVKRTARDVRRWPRRRDVPRDNGRPAKMGVIKYVSSRGDFAFVEVPTRAQNVFAHVSQFGHYLDASHIGRTVVYDRIGKDNAGRDQLIGCRLE